MDELDRADRDPTYHYQLGMRLGRAFSGSLANEGLSRRRAKHA
jgi:ribosomal protein L13E